MRIKLIKEFQSQALTYLGQVEILVDDRPKLTVSIGKKRQSLLENAKGEWIVFFDDDDLPNEFYVKYIMDAIVNHQDIDCIGIRGKMTTDGVKPQTWCHRLGFPIFGDGKKITKWGYDYVRPIIHFNPVKRDIALLSGFNDIGFGEDMDYAKRLNPILRKEFFIDKELFHYRFQTPKNTGKYGK